MKVVFGDNLLHGSTQDRIEKRQREGTNKLYEDSECALSEEVVAVVQLLSRVRFLRPHELQHTRLPCPSLSLRVCSNSCPLSWGLYLTVSSSAAKRIWCQSLLIGIRKSRARGVFQEELAIFRADLTCLRKKFNGH